MLGRRPTAGPGEPSHTYDVLNRLQQTTLAYQWYLDYEYDATGNRTNLQLVDYGDVFNDVSVYAPSSNRLLSRGGVSH